MRNFIEQKQAVIDEGLQFSTKLNALITEYLGTYWNLSSIERHKEQNFIAQLLEISHRINDDTFVLAQELKIMRSEKQNKQAQAEHFLDETTVRIDELLAMLKR